MSYSLTEIDCTKCGHNFNGSLDGLFNASATYQAICPNCNTLVIMPGKAAIIETLKPRGYSEITKCG